MLTAPPNNNINILCCNNVSTFFRDLLIAKERLASFTVICRMFLCCRSLFPDSDCQVGLSADLSSEAHRR